MTIPPANLDHMQAQAEKLSRMLCVYDWPAAYADDFLTLIRAYRELQAERDMLQAKLADLSEYVRENEE